MKIWIDADACPKMVKEVIYTVSARLKINVNVVANSYQTIPHSPLIQFIKVEQGADIADFYIVQNLSPGDLVITADIPLAALIIEKNATALNPRGEIYTEDNINERLSMRNFMHDLRENEGLNTGGPAPLSKKDREIFINSFDRIIVKLMK